MFKQQQLGRGKDRGRSRKDISGNPWPRECRWCTSEKLRLTLLILRWNLDVLKPADVKTVLKSSCKEGIMTNLKYGGRHIIHSLWRWKKPSLSLSLFKWKLLKLWFLNLDLSLPVLSRKAMKCKILMSHSRSLSRSGWCHQGCTRWPPWRTGRRRPWTGRTQSAWWCWSILQLPIS